jgi:hypothetical protein
MRIVDAIGRRWYIAPTARQSGGSSTPTPPDVR